MHKNFIELFRPFLTMIRVKGVDITELGFTTAESQEIAKEAIKICKDQHSALEIQKAKEYLENLK